MTLNLDPCKRRDVERTKFVGAVFEISGDGNHGGIVGGESSFGDECRQVSATAKVLGGFPYAGIGRNSSSDGDLPYFRMLFYGFCQFVE